MDPISRLASPSAAPAAGAGAPRSREETAEQFEQLLVRQFVQSMTKGLFESPIGGDEQPGWMAGQAGMQTDVLTDVLAKHLAEQKIFNFSDLLLKQWQRPGNGNPVSGTGDQAEPTPGSGFPTTP